jgi:chromosome segregation ATPase
MRLTLVFLVLSFLGSGVSPLFTKGTIDLVAMKKEEEARRKKLAKSKLAVNDTNVNSVSAGGKKYGFVQMETEEGALPQEGEALTSAGPKGKTEGDETKRPDFWRRQQSDLEERIATLKAEIESAQLELNKLWSDFYLKNVAAEQQAIRDQISQKTNEMEQKKLFLSESEAQLEQLYEKARKAGIPPGWLR